MKSKMIRQGKWVQIYPGMEEITPYREILADAAYSVECTVHTGFGVGQWIDDNCAEDVFCIGMEDWRFIDELDAVAFKLRWI